MGLEADPEGFGQVGPRRKGKKKVQVRNNQPVWGVVGIAEESCWRSSGGLGGVGGS